MSSKQNKVIYLISVSSFSFLFCSISCFTLGIKIITENQRESINYYNKISSYINMSFILLSSRKVYVFSQRGGGGNTRERQAY